MHAAPARQQRLQSQPGQFPADQALQRAAIFAQLVAQIDELRLRAAAFEQQEAPQQRQRLLLIAPAAQQRQLAGQPMGPKRGFRRSAGERPSQILQQRHRGADLAAVQTEPPRRGGDHVPAGLTLQDLSCALVCRLRVRARAEGELHALHRAAAQRDRQRQPHFGRVEGERSFAVGAHTEPKPRTAAAREPVQQQRVLPRLRHDPQRPEGRMGPPVALGAEAQRQREPQFRRLFPGAAQAQLPALARLPGGRAEPERRHRLPGTILPGGLLLGEGPELRLCGRKQRSVAEHQLGLLIDQPFPVTGSERAAAVGLEMPDAVGEQTGGRCVVPVAAQLPALRCPPGRPLLRAAQLPAEHRAALGDALLKKQAAGAHGGV